MLKNKLKDFLFGCETFNEFADKVKSSIIIRKEECKTHGLCNHSYCDLNGISICIECIKERRFYRAK